MLHIFHHNDADGLMSAAIVSAYHHDWAKVLYSCDYGRDLDLSKVSKEDTVFIVDFSFPKEKMLELCEKTDKVIWIDHHKTSIVKYEEDGLSTLLNGKVTVFHDTSKAGCRLTWEFMHPNMAVPEVVLLAEDWDLWKFLYPHTKVFHAYCDLINSWDVQAYEAMLAMTPTGLGEALKTGEGVLAYQQRIVNQAVQNAIVVTPLRYENIKTVMVNASSLISKVAEALLEKYPEAHIAEIYMDDLRMERQVVSLRSRENGPDVSYFAKMYGGGGHKNAAGYHRSLL
jgi:oligoribonuclease NrnB/cAMP/cGMP phosphodiesterase (DHH superfamily)